MRPIQLKMTAFGPYKATEIVNFEELGEHQLFVISGATGAGKTTIFDGICFALYGQASGEDRTDVRAMRSDFAEGDVQTTVELTFAIQQQIYRIMRQIPYIKAGNKSETPGRVELFMRKGVQEVPVVDRQIVSEINEKVVEILGFTQPQFSQIVMLPQGEFRKFLTSSTENKEAIMRKIFKTDSYREVVDRLKIKKDEAQMALQKENNDHENHVKKIASVLPKRESLLFDVLAVEHANTHQIVEALGAEWAYYAEKVKRDQEQYNTAFKQHGEMLSNYYTAKNINERFDELEQQAGVFDELSERLPEMEKKAERLSAAERTITIEQLDLQYTELKAEVAQKASEVTRSLKLLQETEDKLGRTEAAYKEEESKKREREQLTESLIRLNDSLPTVEELAAKKEMIATLETKTGELQELLNTAIVTAEDENQKVLAYQKEIDELEEKLLPLDNLVEELNRTIEQSRIVEEYLLNRQQVATFEKAQSAQLLTYETNKKEYDQLAEDWLMNEAATLAETLHDGDHCPVCGSIEHPKKAHRTDEEMVVSKEALEKAKERLAKTESDYRMSIANYESAMERLEVQAKALGNFDIAPEDAETVSRQCKKAKMDLETELKHLRESRSKLTDLKAKLKQQHVIAENAFQNKVTSEQKMFEHKALVEKERTLYDHTLHAIPEDVRDLTALKNRIAQLTAKKKEMDRAWEKVQQLREEVQKSLTTAKSTYLHVKNALTEAENKKEIAEERFKSALATSEFSTEAAYRQARLDEATRSALKQELEQFKQRRHTVQETIVRLKTVLEGKEKSDLAEWEASLAKLKDLYESALADVNRSIEYEKAVMELKQNILDATERITQLERKFGKVADLYDIVRGQNDRRLSFERYIQIEYLERIIQSANERLSQLSNGQFDFMRSDRQETRGRQSGLSLDVYDAYTGQTRDVKTLSGGEKFNASLCLALGMSDVIQSFQGSVSVDTMFIDEGFGSLDEESLNKAIDTLIELQKAGRMIGVISHVEELKAAFPAILEVRKSKEGYSRTKFFVK